MSENCVNDPAAAADVLRRWRRLLVTTHTRADGDALGSMLALHRAARLAGKDSRMVLPDRLPRRYAFLFRGESPECLADVSQPAARFAELAGAADGVVVVDTSAFEQLLPIVEALKPLRQRVVVIDHHATADDVGAVCWRDCRASAAGVMVAELLGKLDWPIDRLAADGLAVAILTDTGWLRFPSTDERTLRAMQSLLAAGVRLEALYASIYQTDRPQRIRLLAAALTSLELLENDRVAIMLLTADDFRRCGARQDETEDFVNEPMRIATVEFSALLTEQGDGVVRGSLRSRSCCDVAAIAAGFGGGGHVRAAGFRAQGSLQDVRRRLLSETLAAMEKQKP